VANRFSRSGPIDDFQASSALGLGRHPLGVVAINCDNGGLHSPHWSSVAMMSRRNRASR